MQTELLIDFIKREYGTQQAFADAEGTTKQAINKMVVAGYIVVDGALYSKRRDLNHQPANVI